jgi:hypothetical protein
MKFQQQQQQESAEMNIVVLLGFVSVLAAC